MRTSSSEQQIEFLTNLQRLLGEGSFVSTYKYCLLLALADLSVELGRDDDSTLTLTTQQIAEKFVQYYWRQSTPYLPEESSNRVLKQNTGKQAGIIKLVQTAHNRFEGSLVEARHDNRQWNQMVRKVAEIVRVWSTNCTNTSCKPPWSRPNETSQTRREQMAIRAGGQRGGDIAIAVETIPVHPIESGEDVEGES